jgi:hypothetical protein
MTFQVTAERTVNKKKVTEIGNACSPMVHNKNGIDKCKVVALSE